MADEKYIPVQRNDNDKLMCKETIVYEGIKTVYKTVNKKTDEVYTRNKLINHYRIISYNDNVYSQVNEYINEKYDINDIKQVYLMGDGGSWIFNGKNELSSYSYKINCGLDKFHYCLAINIISKDDTYKNLLYYYSINNDKKL